MLRRGTVADTFGGGIADELPQRGALGQRARQAVDAGLVELVTGFRVDQIEQADGDSGRVVVVAEDGRALPPADRVVVLTGFRPDLSFLSELRLELDPVLQAPVRLAPEIDPNLHSCGSVSPHGAAELAHPEPGLYLVGMKSYGRAPTFLAMTGYEQVRSVAAELAGDHEAAARVELTLPDTGVCGGAGLFDEPSRERRRRLLRRPVARVRSWWRSAGCCRGRDLAGAEAQPAAVHRRWAAPGAGRVVHHPGHQLGDLVLRVPGAVGPDQHRHRLDGSRRSPQRSRPVWWSRRCSGWSSVAGWTGTAPGG